MLVGCLWSNELCFTVLSVWVLCVQDGFAPPAEGEVGGEDLMTDEQPPFEEEEQEEY